MLITIEISTCNIDINKMMARTLKRQNINVKDADVIIICKNEPGRCWTKKPGQTSCVAHG